MSIELTCKACNTKNTFQDDAVSGGAVECPKCGSTIRLEDGDELSETMSFKVDG